VKSSAAAKKIRPALLGKRKAISSAAAELALKAHVLGSAPEMLAELTEGDSAIREITDMVDLTEAPEDAVCSLVIDLLHYCEREKIDWTQDVILRSWQRFRSERVREVQKHELP
jgi:hypothetical protein